MLRIGELAQRGRVTVKTLHHYDDIGLLKPVHVDPLTGYRYYAPEQEEQLARIVALKGLGLSLDQVAEMLNRDLAAEGMQDILRSQRHHLRRQLREVQTRIARIETRLTRSDPSAPGSPGNEERSKPTEEDIMALQPLTRTSFTEFSHRFAEGRRSFLPMIQGTMAGSTDGCGWLHAYSDRYVYFVVPVPEGHCTYALRRDERRAALRFAFILPSSWEQRFDLVDASLPHVIEWFQGCDGIRYLFAQLGLDRTPPTVLDMYLPAFLRHGFLSEYRMDMARPGDLAEPEGMPAPEDVVAVGYEDDMREELAIFAHEVYTGEGVSYSLEDARRCVWRDIDREEFRDSSTFLRHGKGRLVGAVWWTAGEEPWLGEFLVAKACQGRGYGRYLLNESIRQMTQRHPGKTIRLNTCREWFRARSLFESYGFTPGRSYTNLNLPKL